MRTQFDWLIIAFIFSLSPCRSPIPCLTLFSYLYLISCLIIDSGFLTWGASFLMPVEAELSVYHPIHDLEPSMCVALVMLVIEGCEPSFSWRWFSCFESQKWLSGFLFLYISYHWYVFGTKDVRQRLKLLCHPGWKCVSAYF